MAKTTDWFDPATLDGLGMGAFATDADGACLHTNLAYQEMSGISLEDSLGDGWSDAIHPDDRKTVFDLWAKFAENGGSFQSWHRFQRPDKTICQVFVTADPVEAEGELQGYIGTVRDVTELIRTRREMEQDRQRLHVAIEGAELGRWDWNLETGEVEVNDLWLQTLGYNPGELDATHETFVSLIHPDDVDRISEALDRHVAGLTDIYKEELRLAHRDGHWITVIDSGKVCEQDDGGRPIRMAGVHLDITDRKQKEEDLRVSRAFNARVLEMSPDVIFTLNTESGEFGFLSRSLGEVAGSGVRTFEDLRSRVVEEDRTHFDSQIRNRYPMAGSDAYEVDFRIEPIDGRPRWLSCRTRPFDEDENGQIVTIIGALRDVTESREANVLMEELMTQAVSQRAELSMQKQEYQRLADELRLANEKLAHLAESDSLTGLTNHMTFKRRLYDLVESARELDVPIGLIMLDIDHFKRINDSHGHVTGDSVIVDLANQLIQSEEASIVARYGGEEFALAFQGLDADRLANLAEALRIRVQQRESHLPAYTISLGAVHCPAHGATHSDLIAKADSALYYAKNNGRNRVEIMVEQQKEEAA